MKLIWVTVEDYREQEPARIDTESSPTTVYINKTVERAEKTDSMSGEKIAYWKCERATLSLEEYEEYKEMAQMFTMPEFEAMQKTLAEQQLTIAEVSVNTEYSVCLQEMDEM